MHGNISSLTSVRFMNVNTVNKTNSAWMKNTICDFESHVDFTIIMLMLLFFHLVLIYIYITVYCMLSQVNLFYIAQSIKSQFLSGLDNMYSA